MEKARALDPGSLEDSMTADIKTGKADARLNACCAALRRTKPEQRAHKKEKARAITAKAVDAAKGGSRGAGKSLPAPVVTAPDELKMPSDKLPFTTVSGTEPIPRTAMITIGITVVFTVFFGIFADPLVDFVGDAVPAALGV